MPRGTRITSLFRKPTKKSTSTAFTTEDELISTLGSMTISSQSLQSSRTTTAGGDRKLSGDNYRGGSQRADINRDITVEIGEEDRRYGFFKCPKCYKRWESARAFCVYQGNVQGRHKYKVWLLHNHNHSVVNVCMVEVSKDYIRM